MTYKELLKHLFEIRDEKFASFSKSLSNSDYISIGVKNPVLKSLVKEHITDQELELNEFELGKYLEVDYLYFALSLKRLNKIDDQLLFLENNIHKAKSWAITDTMSTYLKKMTYEQFWTFFERNCNSKYIYTRRMSYILGLKFYKDKRVLKCLDSIKTNEDYMVMMSEAWLMATIAIKYSDEIYHFLDKCSDLTLKRKTISKISDSFRFDQKTKEKFKSLRK